MLLGVKKDKTRSFHEIFENEHMDAIFCIHTLISLLNNMQYKYLTTGVISGYFRSIFKIHIS